MSARLPPSTHIATTTTSDSAPIGKMDQPWTFERADLAPLPYFEEDLILNDMSWTGAPDMGRSAALEGLRSGNPFLNTAGPEPIYDFQAPFNPFFNAWDSPAADTIRSNNFSAQQLPVSNSPQAPFPIDDGMSTNNNPRGATMLVASNNIEGPPLKSADNTNVSRRVNQRSNTRGLRVTCEACRKLKIKCLSRGDGEACEKCYKNGISCERKARAAAISRRQPQQSTTTNTATLKMSHTQHNNQRTDERASGSAPDGKTPLFFGEHENEKDMWVNHLRPAGTAPTVLRGGQMSAETARFVEANHILISDPAWVSGLLEAPVMDGLPLLSQPVTYLPGYDMQAGYYPAPAQAAHYWDGMQGGTGYNSYAHYPGADQSAYGHHLDAGQAGYAYGDSAVAYPMTNSMINYAFQGAGNNLWNNSLAPGAPAMPFAGPAATAPVPRRSLSPIKHQTLPYRRRSPPQLNPVAPSFAPSFAPPFASSSSSHQPFLPGYPTAPGHTSYPTVQGHNLAAYGGVVGRRGAWNFGGGVHAGTPYQTRLQEARVLAGSQRRFSAGPDDVRKHLPSGSSA
ncbi:hypothetical protein KCU73_g8106, partial [Aureobasidium melanogenum]